MVGAIADWFAVTALFKHPLGLPIPHTALIPRRKEDARAAAWRSSWGRTSCRRRSSASGSAPPAQPAGWAVAGSRGANARRVVDEAAGVLHIGLSRVRDEDMVALVSEALLPRASSRSRSARSRAACSRRSSATAPTTAWSTWCSTRRTAGWTQNEETFADIVGERAPWWSPPAVNDRVTHRMHLELVAWIEDIRRRPLPPRAAARSTALLAQLAQDLLHDADDPGADGAAQEPGADPPAARW